jgi:DNA-binding winged helix-turn-helix (wHTH) protein
LEVTLSVAFGTFTLDSRTRQLLSGSRPIHLSPKAFDLLAMLVQERPAAMSKGDIHQRLWPHTFVSDGSLAVLVAELRGALGDHVQRPVFVRTLHRFGYAFVASATETSAPVAPAAATQCWLASDTDRAPLTAGDNVVGRDARASIRVGLDPAADLRMTAAGVSRRHALLTVTEASVTLHDLSSKNGTYADDVRVTAPVQLRDGACIRLGFVSLQFRRLTDALATQTQDASPE